MVDYLHYNYSIILIILNLTDKLEKQIYHKNYLYSCHPDGKMMTPEYLAKKKSVNFPLLDPTLFKKAVIEQPLTYLNSNPDFLANPNQRDCKNYPDMSLFAFRLQLYNIPRYTDDFSMFERNYFIYPGDYEKDFNICSFNGLRGFRM